MDKKIIENDEFNYENLIKIQKREDSDFKIKSSFDKNIMTYLGEALHWKKFGEFPLPNVAGLMYEVKDELFVKKDSVIQVVDLFNDIAGEIEVDRNKGIFTQILQQLQSKL